MNNWSPLANVQQQIEALEQVLMRRNNVIRLLGARLLLMLAMVVGFWLTMRQAI